MSDDEEATAVMSIQEEDDTSRSIKKFDDIFLN